YVEPSRACRHPPLGGEECDDQRVPERAVAQAEDDMQKRLAAPFPVEPTRAPTDPEGQSGQHHSGDQGQDGRAQRPTGSSTRGHEDGAEIRQAEEAGRGRVDSAGPDVEPGRVVTRLRHNGSVSVTWNRWLRGPGSPPRAHPRWAGRR